MRFDRWSLKLKFERFVLPDEKLRCIKKIKGLKVGSKYKVICYVPDMVLVRNNKDVNVWYKTKYFEIC